MNQNLESALYRLMRHPAMRAYMKASREADDFLNRPFSFRGVRLLQIFLYSLAFAVGFSALACFALRLV